MNFTFTKVDATNYETKLPRAEFVIYKATERIDDNELIILGTDGNPVGNWVKNGSYTSGEEGDTISTYLESGIYQLVETKAPEGYRSVEV